MERINIYDTFNEGVQHTIVENPDIHISREEPENFIVYQLKPRYRSEVIERYETFLSIPNAMKNVTL